MNKYLWIVLALSIATHFAFFGYPNETVFDEVHFGKFVSGYYTGEYYFDIHPPLGKLMIAGFAKLFDFQPNMPGQRFNFSAIGNKFPDNKYLALRFLPVLAGTLLPLVIFLLIKELGMSELAAFAGGLLIVFDNALLVQSRFVLLDPFLLLFGFISLMFYFKSRSTLHATHYKILAAIFAGLAISIKWTGLSFIALLILIEGYRALFKEKMVIAFTKFISVFLVSLAIYFSVFALHFMLLPKAGPGDAYMSSGFRESGIVSKFIELNREMYESNQRLTATHPYSSQWYTWPFMARPIFYWVKGAARIYFFGNPVIWWGSTVAVTYFMVNFFRNIKNYNYWLLATGYWLNLLPFIGVKRVMFLYHYLTALIFAMLILVYLIDNKKPLDMLGASRRNIFTGLLIAAIVVFIYFAPLTYGLPYSHSYFLAR